MNKNELNEVVQHLLKRIRELPDGTAISTAMLVEEAYNNPRDLRDSLMDIHFALLNSAADEGIYLDMSEYDDMVVGLPYNLNYVIRHGVELYWYCSVKFDGIDQEYSYLSDMGCIREGSYVMVPFGSQNSLRIGIVESCGRYPEEKAPYPLQHTKHIVRLAAKEEYDADSSGDNDLFYEIEAHLYEEDWESVFRWAEEHESSDIEAVQDKVVECYLRLGENGYSVGYLNLGALYYDGRIVEQDYKEAFKYYKLAADAGNARASCNCGYCYYYGRHQEQDYDMAFQYFSRGALLYDDANCLYKLGDMCLNGYGVEKNEKFAFQFYVRALVRCRESEEDAFCLGDAQMRVGKCLLRGIGIDCDPEEAHKLLCSALINFYDRRKTDPFVSGLIRETKELIREAQENLDGEILA